MANILLSFLILICLSISGYGFYRILGGPGQWFLIRFVLSAWAGLIFLILMSTNLYHLSKQIPVNLFAYPLIAFCIGISCIAFIWKKQEKSKINNLSVFIFLIAFVAILMMSSAFLDKWDVTYYYSNNGEYINYALLTDMVQYHGASESVNYLPDSLRGKISILSRESVVAVLCAIFGALFHQSALFIIQPVSYAIAWLAFLSLGAMLMQLRLFCIPGRWESGILIVTYILALFSAANFQLWTLSFFSHYINEVIALGVILYLICSHKSYQNSITLGFAFAAMGCAYPEMIIPSSVLIGFIYIFLKKPYMPQIIGLGIAFIVAGIVGNWFLYTMLVTHVLFYKVALAGGVAGGWDIFGSTRHFSVLLGNFFGLSNIFWGRSFPSIVPFISLILLLLFGVVVSVRIMILEKWNKISLLNILFVGYVVASLFALGWLYASSTNYNAVKFIIAWIWIAYVALAYMVSRVTSHCARIIIALLSLIVGVAVLSESYQFSRGLYLDALHTRYSESDMRIFHSKKNGCNPRIISVPTMPFFNMVGDLMLLESRHEGRPVCENAILVLGSKHASWGLERIRGSAKFQPVYRSDGLTFLMLNK